jgi:hypothetical protein
MDRSIVGPLESAHLNAAEHTGAVAIPTSQLVVALVTTINHSMNALPLT